MFEMVGPFVCWCCRRWCNPHHNQESHFRAAVFVWNNHRWFSPQAEQLFKTTVMNHKNDEQKQCFHETRTADYLFITFAVLHPATKTLDLT